MQTSPNELISYAIDFASYLILKVGDIDRVILYGSVARGDFDEKSDIDLFVDSKKDIEKKVEKIIEDYEKTTKFNGWKLKDIENPIHVITGKLDSDEWKDLKRGIMNTGIVLYGKYKAEAEKIKQYMLFSFENIKPDKKRILIFRKLFGFNLGKKRYPGLAEKTKSTRIGKGGLLVPSEHYKKIEDYFKEKKVSFKIYDLWGD